MGTLLSDTPVRGPCAPRSPRAHSSARVVLAICPSILTISTTRSTLRHNTSGLGYRSCFSHGWAACGFVCVFPPFSCSRIPEIPATPWTSASQTVDQCHWEPARRLFLGPPPPHSWASPWKEVALLVKDTRRRNFWSFWVGLCVTRIRRLNPCQPPTEPSCTESRCSLPRVRGRTIKPAEQQTSAVAPWNPVH